MRRIQPHGHNLYMSTALLYTIIYTIRQLYKPARSQKVFTPPRNTTGVRSLAGRLFTPNSRLMTCLVADHIMLDDVASRDFTAHQLLPLLKQTLGSCHWLAATRLRSFHRILCRESVMLCRLHARQVGRALRSSSRMMPYCSFRMAVTMNQLSCSGSNPKAVQGQSPDAVISQRAVLGGLALG